MAWLSFGSANSGLQIGINNAPIHNPQFYLPSERPETPPNPLSTVPFRRDPDFVDRGTLLDQIHEKGSVPGSRIALLGLGGVGKSQLAIEYCYRVRDQSPETWVFWIHASNATRFEQSCRDIVDRARIPGRQHPKANVFKLLHDWLQDETKGKWVLILDNLDDEQSLHKISLVAQDGLGSNQSGTPEQCIRAYFPQSLNGLIIMTSRRRRVVSHMVEDRDIILVEPMDETHATTLFDKKLGVQAAREDVIQLTAALEFMPLAIVQAAAYIKQRLPRLSVTQYLENFRRSDRQKKSLLTYEGGQLRRDWEAKNSILITWQISFDCIRQESPSAADLLSLMSFFDRQGIPDSLLRENEEMRQKLSGVPASNVDPTRDGRNEDESASVSVVDKFEDDILVLRDYSFISISADGVNFEIHRLVQLAMQEWLEAHEQLEKWEGQFIRTLHRKFPEGKYENWPRCQLLFAHVQKAVAHQPHEKDILGEWGSLLHEAASFAWTRGDFVDSQIMAKKATIARLNLFGLDNEKTLDSFEMLGLAYKLGGQWNDAEKLQLQVMETRKQILGPEHPDTLDSITNLALTYCDQGRWKDAEELQLQVMESYKRVLGLENPHTLVGIGNLASTYRNQGRWKDAEELELQVMETRKRVLGPEHPDTLTSMNNLASTYRNQGRWKDAEELELQVLETRKRVLGPEHPDILNGMNNLALTYWNQGRWKDAEELQLQVMETRKRVLGPEHPDTLTGMNNLAHTFRSLGQDKTALLLMAECVRLRDQKLGPDHPHTVSSKSTLNEWRAKGDHPSSQSDKMATKTKEDPILASFTETSKRVSQADGHRRCEIFSRLFSRKQD
ncbi:Tetratricopeptide-like helical [Penicillium lagena]|uniref:Tetratricopeptide-like helical n=1 Tax=Penicillium lagena TaxID=94218 RepID=UPI0025409444|nr:Tetratricopeptide-like helical [Penicillium lagena]KAJ5612510.1 Tetratricopeptide-like helical [Penicillium lagena]